MCSGKARKRRVTRSSTWVSGFIEIVLVARRHCLHAFRGAMQRWSAESIAMSAADACSCLLLCFDLAEMASGFGAAEMVPQPRFRHKSDIMPPHARFAGEHLLIGARRAVPVTERMLAHC
jgi:hypothetical protein